MCAFLGFFNIKEFVFNKAFTENILHNKSIMQMKRELCVYSSCSIKKMWAVLNVLRTYFCSRTSIYHWAKPHDNSKTVKCILFVQFKNNNRKGETTLAFASELWILWYLEDWNFELNYLLFERCISIFLLKYKRCKVWIKTVTPLFFKRKLHLLLLLL